MSVSVKINKFKNVQFLITSFYYNLSLELLKNGGFLVHNNKTGDAFAMNGKSINALLRVVDCNSFRQLVSLFGDKNHTFANISAIDENTLSAYNHFKGNLHRTFDIPNYSYVSLFLETIPNDLTHYIEYALIIDDTQ